MGRALSSFFLTLGLHDSLTRWFSFFGLVRRGRLSLWNGCPLAEACSCCFGWGIVGISRVSDSKLKSLPTLGHLPRERSIYNDTLHYNSPLGPRRSRNVVRGIRRAVVICSCCRHIRLEAITRVLVGNTSDVIAALLGKRAVVEVPVVTSAHSR